MGGKLDLTLGNGQTALLSGATLIGLALPGAVAGGHVHIHLSCLNLTMLDNGATEGVNIYIWVPRCLTAMCTKANGLQLCQSIDV